MFLQQVLQSVLHSSTSSTYLRNNALAKFFQDRGTVVTSETVTVFEVT